MSAYSLGLLLSIIVYLLVGSYAGRKVKHLEDYFVAGRNAPTLLIVGTLVASLMSTNAFMGETGVGYSGFPSVVIILTAVNCVGYVLGGLYFGRFLRRSRALTLAEYFGQRFSSRRVQAVAGITVVLGCTGYLVVVTQGVATIIHEVTGLSFHLTLLVAWLGYTLFTLYSGSRGVVLTDTIMFLLFSAVALLGLAFIVEDAGGWFTAIRNLAGFEAKPEIISWHGAIGPDAIWKAPAESLIYGIILGVGWGIVVAVSPWQASRFLMARNEHTVIRSAVITAGVIMALYLVLMFSGAAINLINPQIDPAQENMIWAAMNIMPLLVGVLLMSGIMAAGLSSASTFLSLVAFSASNDIMPPRHLDDGARLKLSRQAMLVLSLAALAIAFLLPEGQLFWITYFAGTLFASSWGPVAFMSVWSNRITEAGAFWGIIAGLLGNVVTNIIALLRIVDLPVILDPILVGVFLSYLTIEIVSFRGKVSDREHAWRKRLHETPPEEIDFARTRRTLVWSGAMITFGIALSILMILFYWIPYRQVAADSALGELVLSLGVGFAVALTGVLAWRGTLRSYTVNK
ncbi:MAG: sodium:solute symporter family protein [Gammaproteobacteria bacterium]|jgi:sodium/pantothenate symporter|nr:sodium:solute symporter family protein [Gammaproteobacteria bacterium]